MGHVWAFLSKRWCRLSRHYTLCLYRDMLLPGLYQRRLQYELAGYSRVEYIDVQAVDGEGLVLTAEHRFRGPIASTIPTDDLIAAKQVGNRALVDLFRKHCDIIFPVAIFDDECVLGYDD